VRRVFRPEMGYDRAITVFSPDGRLFQVEYAVEAVRRGTAAIGVKVVDGVILAVEKRITSPLMEPSSLRKIYVIDEHIGVAIAGLHADARRLVDYARVQAQVNKLYYDEPIMIEELTRIVCDLKQNYTQYAGVRPFGVSLLVAGIDAKGPHLFSTHPSGAYWEWHATAIGGGEEAAKEVLEKGYKEDMSIDDAYKLALEALKSAIKAELKPENVELAEVLTSTKKFRILSPEETKEIVKRFI